MKNFLYPFFLIFILTACGPVRLLKDQKKERYGYSFVAHKNMLYDTEWSESQLSAHGFPLGAIRIFRYKLNEEVIKNNKLRFRSESDPLELSITLVAFIKSSERYSHFSLSSSAPSSLGGESGFRIEFSARTYSDMKVRGVVQGASHGDYIYFLEYTASERYYFEEDYSEFKSVLDSFRFTE